MGWILAVLFSEIRTTSWMPQSTPLSCSRPRPRGGMMPNTVRGSTRQRIPRRLCCFHDITARRLPGPSPGMERSLRRRQMVPIQFGASRTITMGALSVSLVSPLRKFQMTVAGRCFQVTGMARWAQRRAILASQSASIHSSLIWLRRPLLPLHLQGRHACDIIRTAGA